jgi:hypothetical protein
MTLEDDVRQMLHRRAATVAVQTRPWSELLDAERPASELVELRPSSRRWLAVAAAVLIVSGAAIVFVGRRTDNAIPVQQLPAHALPFDPATAAPVWPADRLDSLEQTNLIDPRRVTEQYLEARLDIGAVVGEGHVDEDAGLARFSWSYAEPGGPPALSGTVYLRRADLASGARWMVVGSSDDELAFPTVAYAAGRLSFTITNAPGATEVDSLAVSVVAGQQPVHLPGHESLPQGGPPDPALGQLYRSPSRIDVAIPDGTPPPIVLVRQVGGGLLSVSEFAVQPDDAPPGGRLITRATLGARQVTLYGVDRFQRQQETPCWLVQGVNADANQGCGFGGGTPGDGTAMQQIGPMAAEGSSVLLFGAYDNEVEELRLSVPGQPDVRIEPLSDPACPAGARYFLIVVTRAGGSATVDASVGGQVVDHEVIGLDTVGG